MNLLHPMLILLLYCHSCVNGLKCSIRRIIDSRNKEVQLFCNFSCGLSFRLLYLLHLTCLLAVEKKAICISLIGHIKDILNVPLILQLHFTSGLHGFSRVHLSSRLFVNAISLSKNKEKPFHLETLQQLLRFVHMLCYVCES